MYDQMAVGVGDGLQNLEEQTQACLGAESVALAIHVDRFAFREAPLSFDWQDQG